MRTTGIFVTVLAVLLLGACNPGSSGNATVQQPVSPQTSGQLSVMEDLRTAVATATGYDLAFIEVTASPGQIIVQITDSKLLAGTHQERDAEATKIAYAVAKTTEAKANFATIQAIHVNYAKTDGKQSSPARISDGVDFRKDAAGHFTKDVT